MNRLVGLGFAVLRIGASFSAPTYKTLTFVGAHLACPAHDVSALGNVRDIMKSSYIYRSLGEFLQRIPQRIKHHLLRTSDGIAFNNHYYGVIVFCQADHGNLRGIDCNVGSIPLAFKPFTFC